LWVGIDVGKQFHHACAVDANGKTVFSRKVKNRQAAIEELITRTATKAGVRADGGGGGEVTWALDMTSGAAGLLVALLVATGHPVLSVPGRLVNRMTGAFAGEAKTDARDAHTIAETARLRGDLAPVTVPDQVVGDLQVLTARREDLMADWVRGVNRLRELLGSIFPGLEEAFDYSTRSALILLTGFQTPAGVRAAGQAGVAAFLREHRAWAPGIPTMAATAVAVAAEQDLALPAEAVTAPLIARLATQLLDLDREIKDLNKQLATRFAEHPHGPIITSVDGFGPVLGAELLADTGGDLAAAFGTPDRLAAYAGLAPVPRDSGRVRGNLHRPKRYHRGLRRVFYLAALTASTRPDTPSRAFYQRKRAEGKRHVQALIALARRLVNLVWALIRDNRTFTTEAPAPAAAAA
jgi:transposase